MKIAWKGPEEDGITQSIMNRFLVCPYEFFLYAGLGLEDPPEYNANLSWGDSFHVGLEDLIKGETIKDAKLHMVNHLKENHPQSGPTFPHSMSRMLHLYNLSYLEDEEWLTEQEFEIPYILPNGRKIILRGKLDGHNVSRTKAVEHKCKKRHDKIKLRREIYKDTQVCLYSLVTGIRNWHYDVIKIPDIQYSPPAKRSTETYGNQVRRWFEEVDWDAYPINKKKMLWIDQFPVYLSEDNITRFQQRTLNPILLRMCKWYDKVTEDKFDPECFDDIFYESPLRHFNPRMTESFEGSFYKYLTDQCDLSYLIPIKGFFNELSDRL